MSGIRPSKNNSTANLGFEGDIRRDLGMANAEVRRWN